MLSKRTLQTAQPSVNWLLLLHQIYCVSIAFWANNLVLIKQKVNALMNSWHMNVLVPKLSFKFGCLIKSAAEILTSKSWRCNLFPGLIVQCLFRMREVMSFMASFVLHHSLKHIQTKWPGSELIHVVSRDSASILGTWVDIT